MKLAFVINSLGSGGAERLILDLCKEFLKKGIAPDVITLTDRDDVYSQEFRELGICVINLSHRTSLYSPFFIAALVRVLAPYDIVHVHLFPAQYWVALASMILPKRIRFITTEHCSENKRRKHTSLRLLDKVMYGRYEKIVAISETARTNLQQWCGDEIGARIQVITNGIELNRFRNAELCSRDEFDLMETDVVLLMVAAFRAEKDHATVVRAMEHLPPHFHLLFVGDGPLRESLRELVERFDLKDRVHFLGYRKDVPGLMKMADVGILSSSSEGVPLTILEMMASGLPVIGSRVYGIEELVPGAGLMFDFQNSQELAACVVKMMEDSELRDKLVSKGAERVELYSSVHLAYNYMLIYSGNSR